MHGVSSFVRLASSLDDFSVHRFDRIDLDLRPRTAKPADAGGRNPIPAHATIS
jgi:hypothetical protein